MAQIVRNIIFLFLGIMVFAVAFKNMGGDDGRTTARPNTVTEDQIAGLRPTAEGDRIANQLIVPRGPNGQYTVIAEVDGTDVRFLVDTGASSVVLTTKDAERIGLEPEDLDYTQVYQTANGKIRAAPVTLEEIRIGPVEVDEVAASVNESPMGISLLGMTFLGRLEGYQVQDGDLILYW